MEQLDLAQLPPTTGKEGIQTHGHTHTDTEHSFAERIFQFFRGIVLGSKGSGGSSRDDHLLMPLEGKRTAVFPILKDKPQNIPSGSH